MGLTFILLWCTVGSMKAFNRKAQLTTLAVVLATASVLTIMSTTHANPLDTENTADTSQVTPPVTDTSAVDTSPTDTDTQPTPPASENEPAPVPSEEPSPAPVMDTVVNPEASSPLTLIPVDTFPPKTAITQAEQVTAAPGTTPVSLNNMQFNPDPTATTVVINPEQP